MRERPTAAPVVHVGRRDLFAVEQLGEKPRYRFGTEHQVTVVDTAAKALDAVAGQTFDVVLTDFQLGTVTGAQLAEQLADIPSPPFVVLVTGYAVEIDDPAFLSRGVSAVLPKPCRAADLRHVLARVRPLVMSS